MGIFANVTPFSTATGLFVAFVLFAAMLVAEARSLADKPPQQIRQTLYIYACGLAGVALVAGWLAFELGVSVSQPIPAATISAVVDRLMSAPVAEVQK
jgi:nitrate reductase gamma subunit